MKKNRVLKEKVEEYIRDEHTKVSGSYNKNKSILILSCLDDICKVGFEINAIEIKEEIFSLLFESNEVIRVYIDDYVYSVVNLRFSDIDERGTFDCYIEGSKIETIEFELIYI